jgi:hypothetical protein
MSYEKPGKGRSKLNDNGNGLEVIIPAQKNFLITLFLCVWLGGWAFGEVMVLTFALPSAMKEGLGFIVIFTLLWLIGWTIGGAFVLSKIVWNFAGREIINLSTDSLNIERRALQFKRIKKYMLSDVKNFRVLEQDANQSIFGWSGRNYWNSDKKVAFDYGMKTIKFAERIDSAEAGFILGEIKKRIRS